MSNAATHFPPDLAALMAVALQRLDTQERRIAELEAMVGLKLRPQCDDHQRRRRFTADELARLAAELGIVARSNGGALPSDGAIAKAMGIERATFNLWKNSDVHPVGRAYRALAGMGPMRDRPTIARRKDRTARERYRQRADDD